jgi:hypothetical protein
LCWNDSRKLWCDALYYRHILNNTDTSDQTHRLTIPAHSNGYVRHMQVYYYETVLSIAHSAPAGIGNVTIEHSSETSYIIFGKNRHSANTKSGAASGNNRGNIVARLRTTLALWVTQLHWIIFRVRMKHIAYMRKLCRKGYRTPAQGAHLRLLMRSQNRLIKCVSELQIMLRLESRTGGMNLWQDARIFTK